MVATSSRCDVLPTNQATGAFGELLRSNVFSLVGYSLDSNTPMPACLLRAE